MINKNKEELKLLSDIFETVNLFTEMFEKEYSLKVKWNYSIIYIYVLFILFNFIL